MIKTILTGLILSSIAAPISSVMAIGNGENVEKGDWPAKSIVAIHYRNQAGVVNELCTGSVLNRKFILTAAHCFVDTKSGKQKPLGNFKILLATNVNAYMMGMADKRIKEIKVNKVHLHSIITKMSMTGDVAVVELAEKLPRSYRPVKLIENTADRMEEGELFSFGYSLRTAGASIEGNKLRVGQFLSTPIPDHDLNDFFTDKSDYFIHLTSHNDQSTCAGDSGGPTFSQKNNQWYQIGVTHGSTNRAAAHLVRCPNEDSYVTRLAPFITWIKGILATGKSV